jgi:succinoglycan biosynthesis transport protein ExoP
MTHQDVPPPLDADAPEGNAVGVPLRHGARLLPAERPHDANPFATWRRPLLAVRRYKWLVVGVTLVGSAAGVVLARFVHPSYHARATVWIQVPPRPIRTDGPMWQGQLPISSGWMDLLRTNVVLEDVARSERLYVSPKVADDWDALATFRIKDRVLGGVYRLVVDSTGRRFTLLDAKRTVLQEGAAGDSVGSAVGFAWVPPAAAFRPGRMVQFGITPPYEAGRLLGKHLKVSADLDGNFLELELGDPDPVRVTAIVNAVAARFVVAAAELKRQNLTELTHILGAQLERAQESLRNAETLLKTFRVSAVTEYADGTAPIAPNLQFPRDPAFAGLLDMKVNRDELLRDRASIERILVGIPDSGLAVDALAMIGSVQRSLELSQALRDLTVKQAELRALRTRYTDENAMVRRAAAEVRALERGSIPALATALTNEMRLREQALGQRVDSAAAGLRRIPPLAGEETRLQRDVTLAEQTVANFQQRFEEARLADVSSIPDVRLVDPAVQPQDPATDWTKLVIAFAFVSSLGAGVVGAVLIDRSDRHVRYPEHITEALGLPMLGAVPHLNRKNGRKSAGGILPVVEAIRGLRLNVTHAHGVGPVVLTVTSPGRSDGKSFIAANLALAFADAGYRTLLIDGDIRCGALHRVLKLRRAPGLTDLLAGHATREQVVQATTYRTLSFIGSGTRTHAAPALVSSAPMPRALAALRPDYDTIIVDSAPLAAGADGFALGTATGSMLLVLRSGVSDRELMQAKLEVLHQLPIRLLGAVVNDVRLGGAYGNYSYYLEGYEARDEPEPASWKLLRDAGPPSGKER